MKRVGFLIGLIGLVLMVGPPTLKLRWVKAVGAVEKVNFSIEEGVKEKVTTIKCAKDDVPDAPARAFVDSNGSVQLIAASGVLYRYVGDNLDDAPVNRDECRRSFLSHVSADPRNYNDFEWVASPYTVDGKTVYSLVHTEYHGWYRNDCKYTQPGDFWKCWWNSVNLAKSDDGGRAFYHLDPPLQNILNSPIDYDRNLENNFRGYFEPSNIVKRGEYYYALVMSINNVPNDPSKTGMCVMRTNDLADPKSWRLWDGNGFNLPGDRAVCQPVALHIGGKANPHYSLTYNNYLGKYLVIGCQPDNAPNNPGCGYRLSDDLINWSDEERIFAVPNTADWKYYCSYGSLIQPGDATRNFEESDRSPWFYFGSPRDGNSCNYDFGLSNLDHGFNMGEQNLWRVRVRFNKPEDVGKYEILDLRFNEKRIDKTLDSSFYGNNGKTIGINFGQEGERNFLRFTGGNGERVEVAGSESLRWSGDLTVEAELKVRGGSSEKKAIVRSEEKDGLGLYLTGEGKLRWEVGGKGQDSTLTITDNQWHKIAVSYLRSGKVDYYVDNVLAGSFDYGSGKGEMLGRNKMIIGDMGLVGEIDGIKILNYGVVVNEKMELEDLLIWKKEYKTGKSEKADFDKNGKVDLGDLLVWKKGYIE
ncbi:MAG: LamG-like jellyroll fold domain-containing protein [Candidatus Shapirobacteria bacterium]|jgi:hypothetical protein